MRIANENELKVGDRILIQSEPEGWSSELSERYPLDLKFPYSLTIKKLKRIEHRLYPECSYTAMTCGEYGWDLKAIVKAGCVLLESEYTKDDLVGAMREAAIDTTEGLIEIL